MKALSTPSSWSSKIACILVVTSGTCVAETDTGAFPVGWLSVATKSIVIGTRPNLEWEVVPSSIHSQVALEDSGRFSILRDVTMAVRVIGVAAGGEESVEVRVQVAGGGYSQIFLDSRQGGTPDEVALERAVSTGQTIDFGARLRNSEGKWSTWYSSTNSGQHVVALKSGDSVPAPARSAPRKYLLPYLDSNNNVRIGPGDLLLLIEANASHPGDSKFDQQDVAVLVSFKSEFPK